MDAWPWVAYIEMPEQVSYCTATIVSRRHVLTALHCFVKNLTADTTPLNMHGTVVVKAGTAEPWNDTHKPEYSQRATKVIVPHDRSYLRTRELSGDIAIVELPIPLNFSPTIQPICLAGEFRERIGEVGYISGFGRYDVVSESTGESTFMRDGRLRENIVVFRTLQHCKAMVDTFNDWSVKYKNGVGTYSFNHAENLVCIGGIKRNGGVGDSGGPLMIQRRGTWFQVGTSVLLTTTTNDTDHIRRESCMYNRIGPRCDWIREVTGGEVKCVEADD